MLLLLPVCVVSWFPKAPASCWGILREQCVSRCATCLGSQICCGLFAAHSEVTSRCVMWVVLSDYMGQKDQAFRISVFSIGNSAWGWCTGSCFSWHCLKSSHWLRWPNLTGYITLHPLESPLGSETKSQSSSIAFMSLCSVFPAFFSSFQYNNWRVGYSSWVSSEGWKSDVGSAK